MAVPHGHAHRGTQHSDSSVSTFSFSDLRPGFVLGERERMDIRCPRLAWAAGSLGNTNHAGRPWSSMISFKQGTERKSSECSVRAGPALTPPGCVTCFLSSRRLLPQTIRASGREPQARSDCPASSDLYVSSSTCLCCFFPPDSPLPVARCRSALVPFPEDTYEYLLSPEYVPSTMLSTLRGLSSVSLKAITISFLTLWGSEAERSERPIDKQKS